MPLLKRKAFEKSTASGYLRDDDEVFHCEITDEIFKDYEEYCERIILVNSMVWTCEMTGKNNLTYSEALQSERAAKKLLRDFPMELRIPILYLAQRTKRCSFAEMSEDIFNFVRDRYFVGETVEVCLEGDTFKESHILSVTAQKQQPGSKTMIPAASYCYEVEQFDEENPESTGQIGTAPFDRVRRPKGVYTRDKNRLFLKQFVEAGPGGIICIKKTALEKYNISKVSFSQIFTGNPPEFDTSKKLLKSGPSPPKSASKLNNSSSKLNNSTSKANKKKPSPDKKGQQSMDKFVKKTTEASPKPKAASDPAAKKSAQELAEKMRRAEDAMRQRKEEEKARKKEKTARLQAYIKEWQKVKDDLELEDHKILPKGTSVDIEGIPQEHIGDFISVLEFVYTYSDILKAKDVFHNKFDIETFRKALTQKEHAGTFSDLIQMLLTTIFSLQEDEAEEYNENKGIQMYTEDKGIENGSANGEVGVTKAIELATKASKWSQTHLGTPLSKLPLDPTTVSEVLRLHLLSSGAAAGARCATWRYQARGGYSSHDDAGLRLRRARPQALVRLARAHVADLSLDDKFAILQCLMNQILSYATVRDVIEEKLEEQKNKKHSLRTLQINERKREAQVLAQKQELKKEATAKKEENKLTGEKARAVDEQLRVAIENLNAENEVKRKEFENKVKELQTELFEHVSYVGSDRAYRRYWVFRSVGGLLVETGAEPRGPCRDKPVLPADRGEDTLAYITTLFENQKERGGSDKENDSAANSRGNSPKKPLSNLNGLNHKLNGLESHAQQMRDLLMCTGDIAHCPVHGKGDTRPSWMVYHTEEQISSLIAALNKRGLREHELRQALEADPQSLAHQLARCPLHHLNPNATPPPIQSQRIALRKHFQPSLSIPADCSLSEALELSLRDHILELEEKIFHGCLGSLKVKDREAWRGTIMLRGYDKQADYLSWGPNQKYRDDYHLPNGVLRLPTDPDSDVVIPENKYRDPGHSLESSQSEASGGAPAAGGAGAAPDTVRGLAGALLQISQAIHHKYIKRPLGLDEKERKEREARNRPLELEALYRWEVSLMECRSFAQLALHLLALDSSVAWSSSILNASCRLCRRKADPDNMLLCDGCNKGHHLYCLKPKLTTVPEGDWFCDSCRPKERTPRKRRKLFTEHELEEESNSESEVSDVDSGVCHACGSGGRLAATCAVCGGSFHRECAVPRPTRSQWTCSNCIHGNHRDHLTRRCAATAMTNIHQYTGALTARARARRRHTTSSESDSSDSEYNTALVKLKGRRSRASKEASPLQNGTTKRTKKAKEETVTTSSKKSKSSLTNGHHASPERGAARKRNRVSSPALHEDSLQLLLRDTMKHRDSWPFLEPVSVEDVPDYLDVIDQPMDFSTIKSKLEGDEYSSDEQALADVALVFRNCYTYNRDEHQVAKAGYRLEKYVTKRCTELGLTFPSTDPEDPDTDIVDDAPKKNPTKKQKVK